jgi:peptidyl-prolyl cis-trans isomerase C
VSRVLPVMVMLVVAAACSKTPAAEAKNAATSGTTAAGTPLPAGAALTAQDPVKPVPAELPAVIARVNGETITKSDFEKAVEALESRAGGPVPPEQRDRIFRDVLEQLVGYKLLSQEAAARKVTVSETEVDAQIAQIKGQFPSADVFTKMLAERKISLDQVRTDTRRDMVVAKMLEAEVEPKSAVKPEQISDFYTKNPDQFTQGERVRASHILISAPRDADAAAKAQARSRAEQVLQDVKAGKDFAGLAKQHSQDPGSAAQGGDLGYFTQGQMVGPFNDAAFSLKPGTTSDLVETDFGFHIIRVVDKQAGRTVPLEEVRTQLEKYLLDQNRKQQTEAFVNSLRTKGTVEVFI